MSAKARGQAFSLIEVVFSLFILTLALFALLSVCSTGLRVNKKSHTQLVGARVADQCLNRAITKALTGDAPDLWKFDFPYPVKALDTGNVTVGPDTYTYAIYANTVSAVNGSSVGSGTAENLLKKVEIIVWWWGQDPAAERTGYGRMETSMWRLVGQGDSP